LAPKWKTENSYYNRKKDNLGGAGRHSAIAQAPRVLELRRVASYQAGSRKEGAMEISSLRRVTPAVISLLLAGLLAAPSGAQQPNPSGEPASSSRSPNQHANPGTPAGTATNPASSTPSPDKVVLKVGDEQITQADLDFLLTNLGSQVQQTISTQGRRPIGERYALMLVLSQQAINDHLDSTSSFRQQAALQRRQMLAQAEYQHLMGHTPVSPDEIGQYYSTHPTEFDEVEVRQIVVRKKSEGAKEGTLGLAPQEARTRLEEIRKALVAGTDAKKVVQDLSDPKNIQIDTSPRTVRRGQLLPALDKAAFELKDGEFSEIVEVPQALVLLQVVAHRRAEQKDVSAQIENSLRQQKLDAAVTDLKKKAAIWMDEDYFKIPQAPPVLSTVPDRPTQPQ
jgi:peptidyl-prolyl cis-trans isomerase C